MSRPVRRSHNLPQASRAELGQRPAIVPRFPKLTEQLPIGMKTLSFGCRPFEYRVSPHIVDHPTLPPWILAAELSAVSYPLFGES